MRFVISSYSITPYLLLLLGLAISHPKNENEPFGIGDASSNAAPFAAPFQSVRTSSLIGFNPSSNSELETTGPIFNTTTMTQRITAIKGKPVELSCNVIDLGNKTVSWIRHDNLHIISAGHYTYTTDSRFLAVHALNSTEWSLRIKNAQKIDEGKYECQLSTQPVRSFFIDLKVVVPIANILGSPEIYLDVGSTVNLTCIVKHTPMPPADVQWRHNQEVIDYTSIRGGVSVLTNKAEITVSYLIIQKAQREDGGIYTCQNGVVKPAKVKVHVLSGENWRGLQTNYASKQSLDIYLSSFSRIVVVVSWNKMWRMRL